MYRIDRKILHPDEGDLKSLYLDQPRQMDILFSPWTNKP